MKKMFLMFFIALTGIFLTACGKDELILTFSGADDVELEYEEEFNVLEGVKVMGSDGVDYSEFITYSSLAKIDQTTHMLDTTETGSFLIKYTVKLEDLKPVVKNRMVTVNTPERTSMVLNGDFSMGITGWDKFEADGGTVAMSTEEGALKLEIVSGNNPWTPRVTQMGIPFEKDVTYQVQFKAKSSVSGKLIHLQVGEILAGAPYFTNFKSDAQVEYVSLTTEWAEYSFKFTHTIENDRGGILFEFGTFMSSDLDATVWIDDIDVVESTPDPDTTAPVFSGLTDELTISTGTAFNPLSGVTALDAVDGDVTEAIEVTIFKVEGETETEVETIDTEVAGVYKLVYKVTDEAENEAEEIVMLTISDMIFDETDIIKNGDMADADPRPWYSWFQNWGDAPTISVEYVNGEAVITYDKEGDAAWAIQFNQTNLTLLRGKTYKLQFDAKASAARSINVAFATDVSEGSTDYNRLNGIELTTTMQTHEFLFTVTKETANNIKVSFELGKNTNFQAGSVTIDNVKLLEAQIDEVLFNKDFDIIGWRPFLANWLSENPQAKLVTVDGKLMLDITNPGAISSTYELQIVQDAWAVGTGGDNEGHMALEAGATYKLHFDAQSSVEGKVNIAFGYGTNWVPYYVTPEADQPTVTSTMSTYSVEFTIPETTDVTNKALFKFEVGQLFQGQTGSHYFTIDNVKLEKKTGETFADTGMVINGTMEEVVGWGLFVDPAAAGTMAVNENGNLVINVTDTGNNAWDIHLHNGEKNTLTKGTYLFVMKVSSDTARYIRANMVVPTEGFRSILPDSKWDIQLAGNDTIETFVLEVDVVADLFGKVKVEIDFGPLADLASDPAEITIYEINIFKVL